MDCRLFALHLDDWMDGRLTAAERSAMQLHRDACPTCSLGYRQAEELRVELRVISAPALRSGFAERALERAVAAPARSDRRGYRTGLGMALALGLALALGAGVTYFTPRSEPVPSVVLTAQQAENVQLVFSAARPFPGATLSLRLPVNVELVGYGGVRELTWRTDLLEGANLLRLPLIARGPAGGELAAQLSVGSTSKTFRLKIKIRGGDAAGASPTRFASL